MEDIPRIEGLNAVSASVGEQLPVSDTAIFETLDALTRLLDRFELWPEQVNVSEEMELTLIYEGNIRILLGGEEYLEEKITKLSGILPQLEGLSGELHLEDVDERNGDVVFAKDVPEAEESQATEESQVAEGSQETVTDSEAENGQETEGTGETTGQMEGQ